MIARTKSPGSKAGFMHANVYWGRIMKKIITCTMMFGLALLLVTLTTDTANADTAEATYKAKCQMCHGPDGKGETPTGKAMKVKDFSSEDVQKMSDADLTGIITNGKNKMPGYGKSLKPEQVKELVGYIRSLAKK
jgi:cytochrome c6